MTTRASASAVISFVYRLVDNDVTGDHYNDDIQAALDRYRQEARYLQLDTVASFAAGGTATYTTFTAPAGLMYWETDGEITDNDYTVLSPDTSDWTNGRWTFGAEPDRPVQLTGYYHNPYNAAADILEVDLAAVAANYDFRTADGDSYNRSQARDGIVKLIGLYRSKGGIGISTFVRTDVNIF